jgi:hypothetical protein
VSRVEALVNKMCNRGRCCPKWASRSQCKGSNLDAPTREEGSQRMVVELSAMSD